MQQSELFEITGRTKPAKQRKPNIVNSFLWHFKTAWERKYPRGKFTITKKQFGQAKNLLAPVEGFEPMTIEEACARITVYIANDGFKICNHAFNKLVEHWDMCIPQDQPGYRPERTAEVDVVLTRHCSNCGNIMREKRSVWMQHKNKTGRCKICNTAFNVNDVLNKNLSLKDYLPKQEERQ